MSKINNIFFWMVFTIVLSISAFDLYLIIRFQHVLHETESNVLGVWLIELDSGSVALFSAVKMFGTCFSLMIWKKILLKSPLQGYIIGLSLLTFQLFLFCWLMFF